MKRLLKVQNFLENSYGAHTGIQVSDFLKPVKSFEKLGALLVQEQESDLDVALLLDRDIFEAWQFGNGQLTSRSAGVVFEELSHFVYLSFNHNRGRSVTSLELELQSEVDRIFLAYWGPENLSNEIKSGLLSEFLNKKYEGENYEESRTFANEFLLGLRSPEHWEEKEFAQLRKFFHSDLGEKLHMARSSKKMAIQARK